MASMRNLGWADKNAHHAIYGTYSQTRTILGINLYIRGCGWAVVQGTSKKWWALHDTEDDAGPFDTKEDAQSYVEVTYALGSD